MLYTTVILLLISSILSYNPVILNKRYNIRQRVYLYNKNVQISISSTTSLFSSSNNDPSISSSSSSIPNTSQSEKELREEIAISNELIELNKEMTYSYNYDEQDEIEHENEDDQKEEKVKEIGGEQNETPSTLLLTSPLPS